MVTVSDGKSKPVPMRLHLSMEVLKLQREDLEVKYYAFDGGIISFHGSMNIIF